MNRIAILRKERKLSQKELGAIIGVAQNATGKMGNVNQIMTLLKKWHFSLTVQQTTSLDKLHLEKLLFLMKKLTPI